jgi:hypothetical protein
VQERIIELSPAWAVPILASTTQVCQFVAKVRDEELESWCMPQEWIGDNTLGKLGESEAITGTIQSKNGRYQLPRRMADISFLGNFVKDDVLA